MRSLYERLLSVEGDFLDALSEGGEALVAFERSWDRLLDDIQVALESSLLDEETSELAHITAVRIATLADISTELSSTCDTFTSQLLGQLDNMMSELSISERSSPSPRSSSPAPAMSPSRKRRRESYDTPSATVKRKRSSLPMLTTHAITPLPKSSHTVVALPPPVSSLTSQSSQDVEPVGRSRKRRLSETDSVVCSKRPKRLHVGPRTHAVSDSFLPQRSPSTKPREDSFESVSFTRELIPALVANEVPGLDLVPVNLCPTPITDSILSSHDLFGNDGLWVAPSGGDGPLPELDDLQGMFQSLLDAPVSTYPPTSDPERLQSSMFSQDNLLLSSSTSVSSPVAPPFEESSPTYECLEDILSLSPTLSLSTSSSSSSPNVSRCITPPPAFMDSINPTEAPVDWSSLCDSLAWFAASPPPYPIDSLVLGEVATKMGPNIKYEFTEESAAHAFPLYPS